MGLLAPLLLPLLLPPPCLSQASTFYHKAYGGYDPLRSALAEDPQEKRQLLGFYVNVTLGYPHQLLSMQITTSKGISTVSACKCQPLESISPETPPEVSYAGSPSLSAFPCIGSSCAQEPFWHTSIREPLELDEIPWGTTVTAITRPNVLGRRQLFSPGPGFIGPGERRHSCNTVLQQHLPFKKLHVLPRCR